MQTALSCLSRTKCSFALHWDTHWTVDTFVCLSLPLDLAPECFSAGACACTSHIRLTCILHSHLHSAILKFHPQLSDSPESRPACSSFLSHQQQRQPHSTAGRVALICAPRSYMILIASASSLSASFVAAAVRCCYPVAPAWPFAHISKKSLAPALILGALR